MMPEKCRRDVVNTIPCRYAQAIVARLQCEPDELARRVLSPERRLMMKEMDADAVRANAVAPLFEPGHPNVVDIDTTTKMPSEVADLIPQAARKLGR